MPSVVVINSHNLDPELIVFDDGTQVWLKAKRTAQMREAMWDHMIQLKIWEGDEIGSRLATRTGVIMGVYQWVHHIEGPDGQNIT